MTSRPTAGKGSELRLTPSARMPRKLVVSWGDHSVTAMIFAPRAVPAVLMAVATAPWGACLLTLSTVDGTPTAALSIGEASFDLTQAEAEILMATFGGRGLRIQSAA